MKLLLVVASFLFLSSAHAQPLLKANRDSVSVTYTPCTGETAFDSVRIKNEGDSTTVSVKLARFGPWRIIDSSVSHPLSELPLAKGQEVWFAIRHMYDADNRDTLIVADPSSTLRIPLNARVKKGKLLIEEGFDLHLGKILVGDTARMNVTFRNTGEVDVVIDHPLMDTSYFKFTDLRKGDTIFAGQSRTAELIFWRSQSVGTFTHGLLTFGRCAQISYSATARVYDPRAFWTVSKLQDTVWGCARSNDYTMYLENSSTTSVMIDSVVVSAPPTEWSIEGPPTSFVLDPGSKLPIKLTRLPGGGNTILSAYAAGLSKESLMLQITKAYAEPRIRTKSEVEINTVAGESAETSTQIHNAGPWPYRVNKITFEGSPLWSAPNLDTNRSIGFVRSMDITFKFAGAPEGTYAATAYIQGTPCDTVLVQKLTARVGTASISSGNLAPLLLRVHPLPASSQLHVEAPLSANISLLDILGRTVRTATANEATTTIDVSSLTPGSYVLVVEQNDRVESKVIVIDR